MTSALVWGGSGVGLGVVVPPLLAQSGLIYSTSLITTTFFGGALAVLVPLGAARGLLSGVQDVVANQGKPALQRALKEMHLESTNHLTQDGKPQLLESLTFGSSWRGRLVRLAASPFLPSTAQMLTRVQETLESQAAKASDEKVLSAAIGGFVEGFLQDKKDTFSMIGSVAYLLVLGAGFGIDHSYRNANEWKKDRSARLEGAQEKFQETKESWQTKLVEFQERSLLPGSVVAMQEKLMELKNYALNRKKELDPYLDQAEKAAQTAKEQAQKVYEITKEAIEDEGNQEMVQDYLKQAGELSEAAAEEVQTHGRRLYKHTKEAIGDRENQELVKKTWKEMMINAGETMEQAQDRICEEKQFQEMATSWSNVFVEANKPFQDEEESKETRKKGSGIIWWLSSFWCRDEK